MDNENENLFHHTRVMVAQQTIIKTVKKKNIE